MMAAVEAYLATRRAAGFDLLNAGHLLGSFVRFAVKRNETHVRLGPSVAQRDERLKTVCRFARYIRVEDGRHELPPANYFGHHKRRRVPHIYSTTEITRLIEAALRLGPRGTLRPQTYATLLALLASTGLRISEALDLRLADITDDGLLIRNTKFRKTRLVPLHETAAMGLGRYLMRRHQAASGDDHVFVGHHGQSLQYQAVQSTFERLLGNAGLLPAQSGRRPRLHDLRHTFAVRALQGSPAGRGRIHDAGAIEALFVTLFLDAHKTPPQEIILDLDATDDPLHGHQEDSAARPRPGRFAACAQQREWRAHRSRHDGL